MQERKVEELFANPNTRYRIPIYQRHYIWTRNNWEDLWDDIRDLSEKSSTADTEHFAGVIVIHKGEETQEIVDGQQRLTTFQIILCVIRDICEEFGYRQIAEDVEDYMLNPTRKGDEEFKLLPRAERDKGAFQKLVDRKSTESSGAIYDAYTYFKEEAIGPYVAEIKKTKREKKVTHLFNVFLRNFYVDEIEVTPPRNAAKMFESINGRGRALAQFDHLRNNLFLRAGDADSHLYRQYWKHFNEEDDWASSDAVLKSFLKNFLLAKLGQDFNNEYSLFGLYQRKYLKVLRDDIERANPDELNKSLQEEFGPNFEREFAPDLVDAYLIVHVFKTLKRYSEVYKEIATCADPENPIWFYQFLEKEFKVTCWHPLILFLKSEHEELGMTETDLKLILRILESYIVRRMLCMNRKRLHKENWPDDLVKGLISFIRNQEDFCKTHLAEYLKKLTDAEKWPDDEQIKDPLGKSGSNKVNALLIRYILFKIDRGMVAPEYNELSLKNFTLQDFKLLSREHIMPVSWQTAEGWRLSNSGDEQKRDKRQEWLHSIGNLTLLNKKVDNERVRNHRFATKKKLYENYSRFKITSEVQQESVWDVEQIKNRGEKMHRRFCRVWPFPRRS